MWETKRLVLMGVQMQTMGSFMRREGWAGKYTLVWQTLGTGGDRKNLAVSFEIKTLFQDWQINEKLGNSFYVFKKKWHVTELEDSFASLINCIFLLYLSVYSVFISSCIFLLQLAGSHKCSRVPNLCGLNNLKCGSYPKQICIEWFL